MGISVKLLRVLFWQLYFFSVYNDIVDSEEVLPPPLVGINFTVPLDNYVYLLNDTYFDEIVLKQPVMMVQFYMSDSIYHRFFETNFEEAAELSAKTVKIPFGLLDLGRAKHIAEEYDIDSGFELKVFKNGRIFDYIGPETVNGMIDHLNAYEDPEWNPGEHECIELTDDTVDEFLEKRRFSFLVIYDHTKFGQIQLEIAKNSSVQLKHFLNIDVGILNGDKYHHITKKMKLKRTPEIFTCKHKRCSVNIRHVYKTEDIFALVASTMFGGREVSDMEHFLMRSAIHHKKYEPTFIAILEKEDTEALEALEHVIFTLHSTHFIYFTYNKKMKKELNCKAKQCLRVYFPPFLAFEEDEKNIYDNILLNENLRDEEKIIKYIMENSLPLVGFRFTYSTKANIYYENKYPIFIMFGDYGFNDYLFEVTDDVIEDTQEARKMLLPLALKYPHFKFAVSHYQTMRPLMLIEEPSSGIYPVIFDEHGLYYQLNENIELNHANLVKFIEDFSKGILNPAIQSEKTPENPWELGIANLVMETFLKNVTNPDKDVFLICYTHNDFTILFNEKEWHRLGEMFSKNTRLMVAKINVAKNRMPDKYWRPSGFKMFLIKNGDVWNPIRYTGEFDSFEILEFLEAHSENLDKGWPDYLREEL